MADLTAASKTGVNFWARVQIFTLPKHNFRVERPLDLWRVIWLLGAQKCAHNTLPFQTQQNMGVELARQRIPLNSCANTRQADCSFHICSKRDTRVLQFTTHFWSACDKMSRVLEIYIILWQLNLKIQCFRGKETRQQDGGGPTRSSQVAFLIPKNHLWNKDIKLTRYVWYLETANLGKGSTCM